MPREAADHTPPPPSGRIASLMGLPHAARSAACACAAEWPARTAPNSPARQVARVGAKIPGARVCGMHPYPGDRHAA